MGHKPDEHIYDYPPNRDSDLQIIAADIIGGQNRMFFWRSEGQAVKDNISKVIPSDGIPTRLRD